MLISLIILVTAIGITAFWWIFFRERIGYQFPNPLMRACKRTPIHIYILWIIRFTIIMMLSTFILAPTRTVTREMSEKQKHNILIVLDISRSMLADDVSPSRIDAAKNTIKTFISERENDKFGLIVFAGKAFFSLPWSDDTTGIMSVIEHITPTYIRQELPGLSGTAIGDALLLANSTLSGTTGKSSIVFITDGRANIGIEPLLAVDETVSLGYPIYTIAIGATGSSILGYDDPYTGKRITLEDENGNPLQSDIDEKLLRTMSERTGGAYFRAENARSLYSYWNTISTSIGNNTELVTRSITVSYRLYIWIAIILLISIERYMQRRIFYKNHA